MYLNQLPVPPGPWPPPLPKVKGRTVRICKFQRERERKRERAINQWLKIHLTFVAEVKYNVQYNKHDCHNKRWSLLLVWMWLTDQDNLWSSFASHQSSNMCTLSLWMHLKTLHALKGNCHTAKKKSTWDGSPSVLMRSATQKLCSYAMNGLCNSFLQIYPLKEENSWHW